MTAHHIQPNPLIERVELSGTENNRLVASIYRDGGQVDSEHPAILLMHGGGQTRHSWHGAAQKLALRGNVAITLDARGHGESAWVPSQNYTVPHYSADLIAVAQQIASEHSPRNKPPILVGASLGGMTAMFAQSEFKQQSDHPLFSAIVLVDITPRMQSTGVQKIIGFMSKDMRMGFATVEEAADAIAAYLPNRSRPKSLDGLSKNLRQRSDGRWYWHWDPAFVDGPHNIMTGRDTRMNVLIDAARQISVPTLLVRGGKSELVTEEAAQEFLQLVPHAKYVDVTDAGHMVAGDKNDVFAGAVIDFLADQGFS